MTEKRTGRAWRPLYEALAWIITRNAEDVETVATTPGAEFKDLDSLLPLRDEKGERVASKRALADLQPDEAKAFVERYRRSVELQISPKDAWEQLRDAVADGRIGMRARWEDRRRSGLPGQLISTIGPTVEDMKPAAVEGYELTRDARGRAELAPKGAIFANGQGRYWTYVRIQWKALKAEFPAEPTSAQPMQFPERKPVRPRGRTKGSGSLAPDDEPLLDEMEEKLKQREVASVQAAAQAVASKAKGAGTLDSRRDRLAKRFRERISSRNKSD